MNERLFGLDREQRSTTRPLFLLNWGQRAEPAATIAHRLRATVDVVHSIGGAFSQSWSVLPEVGGTHPPLPVEPPAWLDLVMGGYDRLLDGSPDVPGGSDVSLVTGDPDRMTTATIGMHAGDAEGPTLNRLLISADPRSDDDYEPIWQSLDPARVHVVVGQLASIWGPDTAGLTTRELVRAHARGALRGTPRIGCITWLSYAVWPNPTELAGAAVESFGEGTFVTVGSADCPSTLADNVTAVVHELLAAEMRKQVPSPQVHEPQVPTIAIA